MDFQSSEKKNPIQVISCEFCEVLSDSFFDKIPPGAASDSLKSVLLANYIFLTLKTFHLGMNMSDN